MKKQQLVRKNIDLATDVCQQIQGQISFGNPALCVALVCTCFLHHPVVCALVCKAIERAGFPIEI